MNKENFLSLQQPKTCLSCAHFKVCIQRLSDQSDYKICQHFLDKEAKLTIKDFIPFSKDKCFNLYKGDTFIYEFSPEKENLCSFLSEYGDFEIKSFYADNRIMVIEIQEEELK